jgi:PAS domain S-box-containing protein
MSAAEALEQVRRLAEDLVPGARASLVPTGETPPQGLAVALSRADGQALGWLSLDTPEPLADPDAARSALGRLAELARQLAPLAGETDGRENLASVVRAMPVRASMTDRDMRLIAVSESTAEDLRGHAAELVGKRLQDLAPDVFARFATAHERAMAGETLRTRRLEWRDADGKTRWFRSEISPWRDAKGEIAGVLTLAVEITDVVEALETSRRSAERLSIAAGLAEIHIWDADFATSEVVTAGASDIFFDGSFDHEDMFRDPAITIHPDDRERVYPAWAKAVLSDQPSRAEHRINRKDGREVWAASTVKLVRDAKGHAVRIVGAMQNITDRRKAETDLRDAVEAAEAANRAKSAFLATMSHEIRTPLNGVLGMAQAMAADDLSGPQRSRLRTIRHSGETLLTILNDLLDLSKIEAGKLELEVVDFELGHLAQGIRDAFEGEAARKGLRLALEVAPNTRGRYRGDATRLRQILLNLVSNAVKFTEAGEVLLSVERRGETLAFSVVDTGIGIPADRIPHLFNKFEQADASTTRRFGGTGLGLAICRDLAALMDGCVDAHSREGAGSTFELVIALPRVGEETVRAGGVDAAKAEFEPVTSLRVLAAEDNSVNQLVLRTLLQQAGLDPVIVADGQAALAAWREQPWDVVLMDVQMPVMDGPTATRAIRAEEAATGRARTPILALTANAMSHQVEEYVAAGMDGLIPKPIRVEELFAALQAVLDEADEADEADEEAVA